LTNVDALSDFDVVTRVIDGNTGIFEVIMRRYNNRLFRVARSVLCNSDDAMDVVQESWLSIYRSLDQFRGPKGFASWVSRIALNHSLMRVRNTHRLAFYSEMDESEIESHANEKGDAMSQYEPLNQLAQAQLNTVLEQAIDRLPLHYRSVFVMRAVQQLNVRETADSLGLTVDLVKQRYLRGKHLLRKALDDHIQQSGLNLYEFAGSRCDRIVKAVFEKILMD